MEVVIFNRMTSNNEKLLRAPAPTIDRVVPNRGPMWGGAILALTGQGFQNTVSARRSVAAYAWPAALRPRK